MDLPPQLRTLRDFYYQTALKLPPDRDFIHAPGLIDRPTFFTLEQLKGHLNNPMLMPCFFALFWQGGKRIDCAPAVTRKMVQGVQVEFLNKAIIEDYLSRGASLVLEGLDILEPAVNAMCTALDASHECVFSNSVVFFSQKGNEAYYGHIDSDDVLVIHLAGQKRWRIHQRQSPRWVDMNNLTAAQMGPVQAEVVMNPGDALFLKSTTPHQVETTGDYSLHMSFDICDRVVNEVTALNILIEEYKKDASACYTPTMRVMDKLIWHAKSPAYEQRIAALQAAHKLEYKKGRGLLGANRVRALDKWIAAEAAKR